MCAASIWYALIRPNHSGAKAIKRHRTRGHLPINYGNGPDVSTTVERTNIPEKRLKKRKFGCLCCRVSPFLPKRGHSCPRKKDLPANRPRSRATVAAFSPSRHRRGREAMPAIWPFVLNRIDIELNLLVAENDLV
jgi:hypothetical protein